MQNSSLEKVDHFEIKEIDVLKKFRAKGGTVAATFCRFFPTSLLAGFGLRSVRILSGATIKAESAGERIVRSDSCSYCKSIIGNFLEQTSLHRIVDLVIGVIACDQMRRTLERLQVDLKIPVFSIQLPATRTSSSEEYYVKSVTRVITDLGEYLGREFHPQAVRDEEAIKQKAAAKLLNLIWQGMVNPLVLQKLVRLFYMARSAELLSFLKRNESLFSGYESRFKLLLVGSVSCDGDDLLFEILSENGIAVIPLNCTGINALEPFQDSKILPGDNLVEQFARKIFRSSPCIRHRPNNLVYDKIELAIEKTRASGIILKTLPFCDLWYTEKQRMRETFSLPILVLDSGYGEGMQDRLKSRIDAFLETLEC